MPLQGHPRELPMTVQTATPSVLDDEAFVDALRRFRVAQRQVEDAKRDLVAAKDHLAVALHHAATPYRHPGAPIPQEIVAHLYWERDELRVRDIADAFGLRISHLGRVAGPRTEVAECEDCGAATQVVRRSRSAHLRADCEDCQRRRALADELRRFEEERLALERRRWERDGWDPYPYELPYREHP
jgi:hypothetical protein